METHGDITIQISPVYIYQMEKMARGTYHVKSLNQLRVIVKYI